MKIAFILDHPLMSYRIPFFNLLSKYGYDIVIFHQGKKQYSGELLFEQVITKNKRVLGVFNYRRGLDMTSFDLVVCMQNMRLLNLWQISFMRNHRFKFIQWGIGVSSSKGLNSQSNFTRRVRNFLMRFADAVVFYSAYPLQFVNESIRPKCFVALNTIENNLSANLSFSSKDSFVFIGSLNKRKGLHEMIIAFHQYLQRNPINIRRLLIIGEGEEYQGIAEYISSNDLENNVVLLGKIEDTKEKIPFFKRSIASLSLNQAGLSVLESFSFGVPFVTRHDAISGGEHLNIVNNENGFLVHNIEDFIDKLCWLDQNPNEAKELGSNAFKFYTENANMDQMVSAFENAINYATIPR